MFNELPSILIAVLLTGTIGQPASDRHEKEKHYQTIVQHNPLSQAIEDRQLRQTKLVEVGRTNGELTSFEVKKLRYHQKSITRLKKIFISDGKLSKREHRILDRKLIESNRLIWRLTTNQKRDYDNIMLVAR